MSWGAALLLLAARTVHAAAPAEQQMPAWREVPADELTMTAEPRAPGAPAVLLYAEINQRPARGLEQVYRQIKVLTEEGRDRANITIQYRDPLESLTDLEARVIQPDGTIVPHTGTVYDRTLVSAGFVSLHAKSLNLPDVRVGSIIEYRYSIRRPYSSLDYYGWVLSQDMYTRHARFSNRPVAGLQLSLFAPRGWPEGSARPKLEEDGAVRLEVRNLPAFAPEEFMPPAANLTYSVLFRYSGPKDQAAEFWPNTIKPMHAEFERFIKDAKPLRKTVASLVKAGDTDEQKARGIYAHVQRLKNTAYEGPLDQKEQRRRQNVFMDEVADIDKHGFGNSRQLTLYCIALMRAAGLEAQLVLVGSRGESFFEREARRPLDLDASLVSVRLDGKEVLLDPAVPFAPFGLISWFSTGVDAVQPDASGGRWFHTPAPESSDATTHREARLQLSADGELEGTVTVTHTGHQAVGRRMDQRLADTAARKTFLEEDLKKQLPRSAEVKLLEQPDWQGIDTPLQVKYQVKVPDWVVASGSRLLVGFGLFGQPEKTVFIPEKRQHPVYFSTPFEVRDELHIQYPAGYRVESPPAPTPPSTDPLLRYRATFEDSSGALLLRRQVVVGTMMTDAGSYPLFRSFFQTVRGGDEQQVVLVR